MARRLSVTLMFRLWGGAVLQAQPYPLEPFASISVSDEIKLGSISHYGEQTSDSYYKGVINSRKTGEKGG
jgi:hypothetical protein